MVLILSVKIINQSSFQEDEEVPNKKRAFYPLHTGPTHLNVQWLFRHVIDHVFERPRAIEMALQHKNGSG